jgi:hypothetical protein
MRSQIMSHHVALPAVMRVCFSPSARQMLPRARELH